MAAIFPENPSVGQRFPETDPRWEFNGTKWAIILANNIINGSLTANNSELTLSLDTGPETNVDISNLTTVDELNAAVSTVNAVVGETFNTGTFDAGIRRLILNRVKDSNPLILEIPSDNVALSAVSLDSNFILTLTKSDSSSVTVDLSVLDNTAEITSERNSRISVVNDLNKKIIDSAGIDTGTNELVLTKNDGSQFIVDLSHLDVVDNSVKSAILTNNNTITLTKQDNSNVLLDISNLNNAKANLPVVISEWLNTSAYTARQLVYETIENELGIYRANVDVPANNKPSEEPRDNIISVSTTLVSAEDLNEPRVRSTAGFADSGSFQFVGNTHTYTSKSSISFFGVSPDMEDLPGQTLTQFKVIDAKTGATGVQSNFDKVPFETNEYAISIPVGSLDQFTVGDTIVFTYDNQFLATGIVTIAAVDEPGDVDYIQATVNNATERTAIEAIPGSFLNNASPHWNDTKFGIVTESVYWTKEIIDSQIELNKTNIATNTAAIALNTAKTGITTAQADQIETNKTDITNKQDELTAGNNINITNNVISSSVAFTQSPTWWQIILQGKTDSSFTEFDITGGLFKAIKKKTYLTTTYFRVVNQTTNTTKSDGWYTNTTTTNIGTEITTAQREF